MLDNTNGTPLLLELYLDECIDLSVMIHVLIKRTADILAPRLSVVFVWVISQLVETGSLLKI